VYSPKYPV